MIGLVVVALAPACDGGPTKQEYIARADAICREVNRRTAGLNRPRNKQEFVEYASRAKLETEKALSRLRELEPPQEDAELIERWLDLSERAVERLPEVVEAIESGDNQRVAEASAEIRAISQKVQQIARAYGFEECSSSEAQPPE